MDHISLSSESCPPQPIVLGTAEITFKKQIEVLAIALLLECGVLAGACMWVLKCNRGKISRDDDDRAEFNFYDIYWLHPRGVAHTVTT